MPVPIRRPARRRAAPITFAVLATAAGMALAGCSTTQSSSTSAGSAAAAGAAAVPAEAKGSSAGAAASDAGSKAATLDPAAVKPRVVRTAQVVVQVDGELSAAAARVRAVAESLGGTVADETTTYADTGDPTLPGPAAAASDAGTTAPARTARPGESVLVLRVPTDSLDRALTLISGAAGVGRELSRSATAQDVTGDLADLQSRVATQKASVARVRALLAQATSLQQVVSIESEVTKREADLEAAQARQAALAGRADFATLTVDLRTPAVVPAPSPEPNPFLGGLAGGWHAVTASTSVVLTVLGALLPVAVVVVVLGAPVLWWLRRRRRPVPPAVSAPAPDAGA